MGYILKDEIVFACVKRSTGKSSRLPMENS